MEKVKIYVDGIEYEVEKNKPLLQSLLDLGIPKILIWARDNNLYLSKRDLPKMCPYTFEEAMTRDLRKEV